MYAGGLGQVLSILMKLACHEMITKRSDLEATVKFKWRMPIYVLTIYVGYFKWSFVLVSSKAWSRVWSQWQYCNWISSKGTGLVGLKSEGLISFLWWLHLWGEMTNYLASLSSFYCSHLWLETGLAQTVSTGCFLRSHFYCFWRIEKNVFVCLFCCL